MSNIDERVVEMKFNNGQFQRGASETMSALDKLKEKLNLSGATKGINELQAAGNKFNLSGMGAGVDGLSAKFLALATVGITALSNITNKAIDAGIRMVKSLTIDPVQAGLAEYETNLNSIQTILANTGLEGQKGLNQVNSSLKELNDYSDQTIYNFSEMARNIGTFTAAGVKLKPATSAIKGIANLAALSGSNSQQASTAMYQLSQAISSGTVKLMDWNSVVNAGMGGKVFQEALKRTARAHGTNVDAMIKKNGSFRESLQEGWLTSKVLTETLAQFTGDLSDAQLKSMGYSKEQIKEIQKTARAAKGAATEIKTGTQLLGALQESVGSGWAQTWQLIIGDFGEAKKLWTGVNDVIGGMIQRSADARNALLADWKKLGGRTALIDGIKNGFQALMNVITPIKQAFRDVFPAMTGKNLADLTKGFRDFMATLKMGPENMERLRRTFVGIFSVFKIVWSVLKGVVGVFTSLFGVVQGGGGGFLALTAAAGDFLLNISKWIEKSGAIKAFFDGIAAARDTVLVPLVQWIGKVVAAFGALFKGDTTGFIDQISNSFSVFGPMMDKIKAGLGDFAGFLSEVAAKAGQFLGTLNNAALQPIIQLINELASKFGDLKDKFSSFVPKINTDGIEVAKGKIAEVGNVGSRVGKSIASVWDGIKQGLSNVGEFFAPILDTLRDLFTTLGSRIKEYIADLDMQDAVALLNTGFFIAMYAMIRKFVKNLNSVVDDFKGMMENIGGTFEALTKHLETLQKSVKAKIILEIAIAVGILAAALYVLAQLDPKQLGFALGGIAGLFIMLTVTMKVMFGMMKTVEGQAPTSAKAILSTGGAMVLLAGAVLLLSFAVKNLAGLDWAEMARGLIATGALLGALALFTKFADTGKQSIKGTASLIVLAGAVYLLSIAVSKLGQMDTGQLVQGGVALLAILTMLTASAAIINNAGSKGAGGILAMATALAILAPIIILLGTIPYEVLAKGLGTLALALGLMTAAAVAMTKWGNKGAPGIVAIAGALAILAPAIALLGLLPYEVLAKGLVALAVGLGIMVGATILIAKFGAEAVPGILAMSLALLVMSTALIALGQLSWEQLAIGLVGLAAGFAILLVAAAAAIYLSPGLLALGITMGLLGAAMMMAGLGMVLFATGFATLAAVGVAGVAVLVAAFEGIINLIPLFMQQIGLGFIAFAKVISDAGPVLVEALTTILLSLLLAIDRVIPKFIDTVGRLVMAMITKIAQMIPQIAEQGARMILRLLTVIGTYIGPMADKATRLMIAFINAIATNVPKLVDAGAKAIIKFVNGLADAIDNNAEAMGRAGGRLATSIVRGLINGLGGAISEVASAARNLASNALGAIGNFLGIHSPSRKFAEIGLYSAQGFALGLKDNAKLAGVAANEVGQNAIDSMRKSISGLANIVNADIDAHPVITPVLDLSSIRKDAGKLDSMLPSKINVNGAYSQARSAADMYQRNVDSTRNLEPTSLPTSETNVTFNQYNNSPKALSEAEIYRQTNNQLSRLRGGVTSNA